jgi:UDP-glucose 4-epimerase
MWRKIEAMNVLVTGGAGYIGSHTAEALALKGYQPIVIDDLSTRHAHNVKRGPLMRATLSDTAVVRGPSDLVLGSSYC